jgi:hypothetical protein
MDDEFVIDGSHFGGILQAVDHMLSSTYKDTDVELVCNSETEEYTLRTRIGNGKYEILTVIPY